MRSLIQFRWENFVAHSTMRQNSIEPTSTPRVDNSRQGVEILRHLARDNNLLLISTRKRGNRVMIEVKQISNSCSLSRARSAQWSNGHWAAKEESCTGQNQVLGDGESRNNAIGRSVFRNEMTPASKDFRGPAVKNHHTLSEEISPESRVHRPKTVCANSV